MATEERRWTGFALMALCLLLIVPAGCAKKMGAIRNQTTVHREQKPLTRAPVSAAKNGGGAGERALREQELREQTLGERTAGGRAYDRAQIGGVGEAEAIPKEGLHIPDIHFAFDAYKLDAENQAILKAGARALAKHTNFTLVIEGHCDERGTREYNLALGQRRADEAARFLIDSGIARERIKTISYGDQKPLDTGHDEAAWAKNRRDHFAVSPTAK